MTFEAPWMFAALGALFIVAWFHLRKQKQRVVAFPTVVLLQQIVRRRHAHLRLRQVLLLALRLLAVLALVLAMTRPSLTVYRKGGVRSGASLAQVIIIDDSASTAQAMPDGQTAFREILRMAEAELRRLRSGDKVAVVRMGRPPRALQEKLTHDVESVIRSLTPLAPTYRANDLDAAMRKAVQLLQTSRAPQKEILLLTDMCGIEEPQLVGDASNIQLRIRQAAPPAPPQNVSVANLQVSPAGTDDPLEVWITATLINHGSAPIENLEVTLFLDGRESAKGTVDIPADAQVQKVFHHRFAQEGVYRGAVVIPRDGLSTDNARYVSFRVQRALQLYVINGDARPDSWEDEAFYLMKALGTSLPAAQPIQVAMSDVAGAGEVSFSGFDAVMMVGANRPPASLVTRLTDYAQAGGGVFISPSAAQRSFDDLGALLPGRIHAIRRGEQRRRPYRIGHIDREHAVFRHLQDATTGLEDVRIVSHLLVEPNPNLARQVIISLSDGVPLLLEHSLGQGRVMLLGTTLNRAWSDLPIRPGFLLLMQGIARSLAQVSAEDPHARMSEAGQSVRLEVNEQMQRLVVLHPDDSKTVFTAKDLGHRSHVAFDKTETPGVYRVWGQMAGQGALAELPGMEFVINVARAESDLRPSELAARVDGDASELYTLTAGKLPVWPWLLIVALLALVGESLVAGIGLRRSHRR
ncbi:MAG: VWA domain-containing protein [Myxococcales bacterium]|nr:VWA domain-containing protein [Myxococcales bacterium]